MISTLPVSSQPKSSSTPPPSPPAGTGRQQRRRAQILEECLAGFSRRAVPRRGPRRSALDQTTRIGATKPRPASGWVGSVRQSRPGRVRTTGHWRRPAARTGPARIFHALCGILPALDAGRAAWGRCSAELQPALGRSKARAEAPRLLKAPARTLVAVGAALGNVRARRTRTGEGRCVIIGTGMAGGKTIVVDSCADGLPPDGRWVRRNGRKLRTGVMRRDGENGFASRPADFGLSSTEKRNRFLSAMFRLPFPAWSILNQPLESSNIET